jgi:hypothetical protein
MSGAIMPSIEKFANEGAAMVLDLTGVPSTEKAFNEARNVWEALTNEQKFRIMARHAAEHGTFDPTTGEMVCYCCGKNWYKVHGRNFTLH